MTVTTLKLEGRLDTAAVAKMETGFAAKAGAVSAQGGKAILDLSDLSFLSSMGIRLVVTTLKQFKQRGVPFATVAPSSGLVADTLRTADLIDHLNVVESSEAAHAMLAGGQRRG